MTNWILNRSANTVVYIFYSPWLMIGLIPLTPLYGDLSRILIPVFFIFWMQMMLYYVFTSLIGKRLIILDNNRNTTASLKGFTIHSIINATLLSMAILIIAFGQVRLDFFRVCVILSYLISELVRSAMITNLIVNLENHNKDRISNKIATFYLIINPLLGLWNLHSRLKRIILDK